MANEKQKIKTVPGLRVTARSEGFRRGGRAWSVVPVEVPLAAFTKDQLAQIRGEAHLAVEDVDIAVGE